MNEEEKKELIRDYLDEFYELLKKYNKVPLNRLLITTIEFLIVLSLKIDVPLDQLKIFINEQIHRIFYELRSIDELGYSSTVEQFPVKESVVGSSPASPDEGK